MTSFQSLHTCSHLLSYLLTCWQRNTNTQYARVTGLSPAFCVRVWLRETILRELKWSARAYTWFSMGSTINCSEYTWETWSRYQASYHSERVPGICCSWGVNWQAEIWYSMQSTNMSTTGDGLLSFKLLTLLWLIRTVKRRMSEYEIRVHALYSQLTDQQLDGIVRYIQTQFPTYSNWQMQGHQLASEIRVQQQLWEWFQWENRLTTHWWF